MPRSASPAGPPLSRSPRVTLRPSPSVRSFAVLWVEGHPPASDYSICLYCHGAEAICAAGTVESRVGLLSIYNPPATSIRAANTIVAIAATSSSTSFIGDLPRRSPNAERWFNEMVPKRRPWRTVECFKQMPAGLVLVVPVVGLDAMPRFSVPFRPSQ